MNAVRYNKRLVTMVFVLLVFSSIYNEHRCNALEKNRKMNQKDKLSFNGNWNETKAVKIVTNICKRWLFDDAQGGYNIKSSLSFQRNNIKKRFFQISANGESCHFCPGLIGAIVFSERNGIWEVDLEEEHFAKFGSYGVPPEAKLISIGSNRYGLLFQWWRSGQGGGYVHHIALIDLGVKDYPLILQERIYQSDDSLDPSIPKLDIHSNIEGEFYDIKIGSKIFYFETNKYKALGKQHAK